MPNTQLKFTGLTCDACARLIQKRLGKIEGVQSVSVDLTGAATLSATRDVSNSEIKAALAGTNYNLV